MDDVGRLWHSAIFFVAALIIMFFASLCGNAILALSDSDAESMFSPSAKPLRAKRLMRLHSEPDIIMQTNLAVRTLLIIALSAFSAYDLFIPLYRLFKQSMHKTVCIAVYAAVMIVIAVISAAFICAFGVSIPKRLCLSGKVGKRFVNSAFSLYSAVLFVFRPSQVLVSAIMRLVLSMFGVHKSDFEDQVTEEEILEMLDAAGEKGGIEEDQAEMISNIFEFSDTELHEVMTHRTEICAVEDTQTVSEAVKAAVETGVSRIPVYHETIDEIIGILYVKDLLPIILKPEDSSKSVKDFLHTVKFMPESGSCEDLFNFFMENNKQIAVLHDEYGGTAGIVTMEDLLECIVGSIGDEYDEQNEPEDIEEITPHTFDIQGYADPEEVMEALDCAMPEDKEFDTIGGLITDLLGYIPEDGQTPTVKYNNITFAVIKAKDNRIEKIRAVKDVKKAVLDTE